MKSFIIFLLSILTLPSCFSFDHSHTDPICIGASFAYCEHGERFNEETCECQPIQCDIEIACEPGFELSPYCECQLPPCEQNVDCPIGSYCEFPDPIGTCVESTPCASDCPQDDRDCTCPDEQICNVDRSTCEPVNCSEYDEETCIAADAYCFPAYYGIGCEDPNGLPCTPGQSNCVCENFFFGGCATAP